jgi:hypothetical protein
MFFLCYGHLEVVSLIQYCVSTLHDFGVKSEFM